MCNGRNTVVTKGVYPSKIWFGTRAAKGKATANTPGFFTLCQNLRRIGKAGKAIMADHKSADGKARDTCANVIGT
jgi:hypothetical protein